MLEVGNFKGPNNLTESKTHFGGWCIVSAPLILGMDLTDASSLDAVWPIISNKEAVRSLVRGAPSVFLRSLLSTLRLVDDFFLLKNPQSPCTHTCLCSCLWLHICI